MKLYYSKGACSLVPRIIINELGLTCDFEAVDLASKKTQSGQDFLKINPKGAVPTLVTSESEILTENAVILQYLADTNKAEKLLPFIGNFKRYRVLEWLNYVTTELHKTFSHLFNPKLPQENKETVFIPLLKKKFVLIDNQLGSAGFAFLCGDHFTLPDAYLFVMLTWAVAFKFDLNEWPHLNHYFKQLLTRESIAKSLSQEGLNLPAMA